MMPMEKYLRRTECDNCPFANDGAGLALRKSLRPGRWRAILKDLRKGAHFLCHKTLTGEEDSEGEYQAAGGELLCAGSRAYQASLGIVSDIEQIFSRAACRMQRAQEEREASSKPKNPSDTRATLKKGK